MYRRQFLKNAAALPLLAPGVALFLSACGAGSSGGDGGGSAAPQGGGDCVANGTVASVGSNHGHSAPVISAGDVVNGVQQTFLVGGSGHVHAVTLSAADFAQLQAGNGLVLQTDADGTGHSHAITIGCA